MDNDSKFHYLLTTIESLDDESFQRMAKICRQKQEQKQEQKKEQKNELHMLHLRDLKELPENERIF
jgi:hypothetical protein